MDKEAMKKKFYEVTDSIEAVKNESAALRGQAKAVRDRLDPVKAELKGLNAQIAKVEEPRMIDLKRELATLSRSLGSHPGPRA